MGQRFPKEQEGISGKDIPMVAIMTTENGQVRTILYIEDNAANRQLVEMIIERRNDLQVILAENGRDGLKLAEERQPDLILLDNSLPDIGGPEVLAHLRMTEKTKSIPVVSLSGSSLQDSGEDETAVFDDYLAKPIDIQKFYTVIDKVLRL
jgi:CheY-like chemotaxis protein